MDLKRTSYQFHKQIETPSQFLRREWKSVAVCAGGFSLAMIAAIFLIDPAFFYPRLQTDPLNYYLKAQALISTGSTSASWAVNLTPFAYVSMPGVLRAPLIAAFGDFDSQLRAIQLMNILIVGSVALLSAYIFSWTLDRRHHWMAVAFAFSFTLLSPIWVANVFLPLADAPYAVFTLASVLISIEILCSDKHAARRPVLTAIFIVVFVVAFLLRFTAPVLLLFAAILARARWQALGLSRRLKLAAVATTLVTLVVLIALNTKPIFDRYFYEPIWFLRLGEKPGMLINLLGAAIPSQVIPSFQLGFMHPPVVETFRTSFSTAVPDAAWAGVGILISAVVIAGMWQARRRFLPELWYVLASLPILTLIMPSTTRYLMPYQAFFWIFFYIGTVWALNRFAPGLKRVLQSRLAMTMIVSMVLVLAAGLRSWKVAGTAGERYFAVTATQVPTYVSDVSSTFRSLRSFIETLPEDRTLLIGGRGTVGRWKAISNRDYYQPDSALAEVVGQKDVYLVLECGMQDACLSWDVWKRRNRARFIRFGTFAFDSVFATGSGLARAEVLRLRVGN